MPQQLKAYIETSIVSYLTAWPSRDLVRAAQQQVTREWWAARGSFELFVSQFVLDEAGVGDQGAAASRLAALREAVLLEITEDAILLADQLLAAGCLPPKARIDSFHVALATVHGMDYLLTWNCKHIANASLRGRIEDRCRAAGFEPGHLHAARVAVGVAGMEPDPIMAELHAVREALSQASDDDIRKIAEAARARQAKSGRESVRLPPRPAKAVRLAS